MPCIALTWFVSEFLELEELNPEWKCPVMHARMKDSLSKKIIDRPSAIEPCIGTDRNAIFS